MKELTPDNMREISDGFGAFAQEAINGLAEDLPLKNRVGAAALAPMAAVCVKLFMGVVIDIRLSRIALESIATSLKTDPYEDTDPTEDAQVATERPRHDEPEDLG